MAVLRKVKIIIVTIVLVFLSSAYADADNGRDVLLTLIAKIDSMQAKIVKLEKSEARLKQSIGALIGTTAQFRLQIADLSTKLEAYEKSDQKKDERIKILENGLFKISETDCVVNTDDSEGDLSTESDKVLAKEVEGRPVQRGIRQTPEHVAFSSYLDHVIRNLGPDQPIVYNMLLLNEAGAYSETTGKAFRVPVSGVYLFSWSITAKVLAGEHNYDVWVKVLVNGFQKTDAVAESQSYGDDNQVATPWFYV